MTRRILEYSGVPVDIAADYNLEEGILRLANSDNFRDAARHITTEYVSGSGPSFMRSYSKLASSRYPEGLSELMDRELNIFRSMWDRQSLIFLLDVEYVSHRFPEEAYYNPGDALWKIEPAYHAILDTLAGFGLKPLVVGTGQGYHFVFRVDSYESPYTKKSKKITPITQKLVDIGFLEDTLCGKYLHLPQDSKRRRVVKPELGKAFDGVSKIMEYIVHGVISRANSYGLSLPLSIGNLIPGNDKQELINLDLSSYADPIYTRVMRHVFSIYDKHRQKGLNMPILIAVPRKIPAKGVELDFPKFLSIRKSLEDSAHYASEITTPIPEQSDGVENIIESYKKSELYRFHKDFDDTPQEDPRNWRVSYDNFDLSQLPPCVAAPLVNPNPSMLQPQQIQSVVRVMTGKKWWHPSHVAGLIRSKYERDHGWDYNWKKYDANRHARIFVRFYSGLIATGLDDRRDQNCISHSEKFLCVKPFCGKNLGDYR